MKTPQVRQVEQHVAWAKQPVQWFLEDKGFRHPTMNKCMGWFAQINNHLVVGYGRPTHMPHDFTPPSINGHEVLLGHHVSREVSWDALVNLGTRFPVHMDPDSRPCMNLNVPKMSLGMNLLPSATPALKSEHTSIYILTIDIKDELN